MDVHRRVCRVWSSKVRVIVRPSSVKFLHYFRPQGSANIYDKNCSTSIILSAKIFPWLSNDGQVSAVCKTHEVQLNLSTKSLSV